MFPRLKKLLSMVLEYVCNVLKDVKITKWRAWYTGESVYIRVTLEFNSSDEFSVHRVLTFRFTKDGMRVVKNANPKEEEV